MNIENKVLERVQKMVALGNSAGATEAERETALRMAYNLLAKHNLEMSDLPSDQDTEARSQEDVVICGDRWIRSLAQNVAKLFFCNYFYSGTGVAGKDRHCFVGRQSNLATARYMSEYLIKSIKREASRRYKTPTTPEGRSFCVGTVASIRNRIAEMLKADTESTPGTALVLNSLHDREAEANALVLNSLHDREAEANARWLAQAGVELTTGKRRADNSLRAGAFFDGKDYGNTVSLAPQVTGNAGNLKRLQ